MKDSIGKVFVYQGEGISKCLICDALFNKAASRAHFTETCFPVPPACPPIPFGVVKGEA
jgi:hypothetical protein